MNSVEASSKKSTLDSFFCADISDVMAASVAGGALTAVSANAYALGNSTLALTNVNTTSRPFGDRGSISLGWGTAVAIGKNPSANVSVFGTGDFVTSYTSTTPLSTTSNSFEYNPVVSIGFALAIDF